MSATIKTTPTVVKEAAREIPELKSEAKGSLHVTSGYPLVHLQDCICELWHIREQLPARLVHPSSAPATPANAVGSVSNCFFSFSRIFTCTNEAK
jgi:hypothetical protein